MSSVRIGAKMAFFRGFGPRRAAVWAEQPFFSFAIIFYHPKEHSLRVSALYSKIFLNYTFGLDILRSAERPFFSFAIIIWHLNEHSVRVSALNSKIFLISTPFHYAKYRA